GRWALGDHRHGAARLRGQISFRTILGGRMSWLRLPRSIYDAIRAHGEETYPNECCGALLGRFIASDQVHNEAGGWVVEAAVRAGNTRTDSAHNRYQIAPNELVKIEREARG